MYELNIPEVDEQHQRLFALANRMYDAYKTLKGDAVLDDLLAELAEYTATHFETEERYMQESGYPGLDEHRREHERLAQVVAELRRKLRSGETRMSREVMQLLKDWLTEHILEMDLRFGEYYAGHRPAVS
jgi:hemerythrin-like metal-binding protein